MHMNGGVAMFSYRQATLEDLETVWDYHISQNPGDDRYLRWRQQYIGRNRNGEAVTFVALCDALPIAEVTLDYHASGYSGNRELLADGKTKAYVTALRILRPDFEGQGHCSALMRELENYARRQGFSQLSIGVEAAESRNLAIYLHWGYTCFLMAETDCGETVLFYAKQLSTPCEPTTE